VCRLTELVLLLQLLRRNVLRAVCTVGLLSLCSQAENAKVYEVWPSTALQTTLQTAQLAKLRFKEKPLIFATRIPKDIGYEHAICQLISWAKFFRIKQK
jgi:hypothetical protein